MPAMQFDFEKSKSLEVLSMNVRRWTFNTARWLLQALIYNWEAKHSLWRKQYQNACNTCRLGNLIV